MNDAEQREKFLKIVAKQTERLHAILEDLLTLARVEQEGEKSQNVLARGSLRSVLEAAVADCGAKAEEKNMQIELTCPAELTASMNASLLEQAVVNLIENAIAYSPPGQSRRSLGPGGRAGDRDPRPRPWLRHQPRAFAADLRALLPRRQVAEPRIRRHRPRPGHRQAHRPAPRRPNRRREHAGRRQHVLHFLAEVTLRIVNQQVLHSRFSLRERTPLSRSERRQLLTRRSYRISIGFVYPSFCAWVKSSFALAFSPIFP